MKKFFLLVPVAALAMTACTSESNEFVGDSQQQAQKEIAFMPLAQPQTRAALHGTTLTNDFMYVAAYQSEGEGTGFSAGDFFAKKTFKQDETVTTVWRNWDASANNGAGDYAPIFWPLSAATINFLAVTGNNGSKDINNHTTFHSTSNFASDVTVAYTTGNSYSKDDQVDIMYGVGRGVVSHASGVAAGGTVASDVYMTFNHALALLNFQVKAKDATTVGKIKINSITINGARYTGTLLITNASYNYTSANALTQPTITWTPDGPVAGTIPEVTDADGTGLGHTLTAAFFPNNTDTWWQKMIIPTNTGATATSYGFNSFTINYTVLDENNHTYDYIYYPEGSDILHAVEQGKIYTYQITFNLHEIRVEPHVANWTENGDENGAAQDVTVND